MALKRDKLDKIFSEYIRARDKFTCTYCHKYYGERNQGLHCSHFWGRRNRSVRWDEENADAHCYYCHQKLGSNPEIFRQWKLERMGKEAYDYLMQRAMAIRKWTKIEKEELHLKYQNMLQNLNKDI